MKKSTRRIQEYLSHTQLDDMIRQTAKIAGWLAYHTHNSRYSEEGYPDWTIVKDGITYWIEIKVGKDTLTDAQKAWIKGLPDRHAFAVREANIGLVIDLMTHKFVTRETILIPQLMLATENELLK